MNHTITHYQTSFRVVDTEGAALKSLKRNVHGWVASKEADPLVRDRASDFLFRCDWQNLFRTHSRVRTNTFLSQTEEAWAMHYREIDGEVGQKRFWYSDIGFKKAGTDVIVSIRISYAWNTEDLSGQRLEPGTTVPKVVRYLVQGNTVYSGRPDYRLIQEPAQFKLPGMGKVLAEFIQSPDRRYPLLVFNGDGPEQEAEAARLARDLTGKAQVAIIGNNSVLAEDFRRSMDDGYYVPFGFFRVFFPFNKRRNSPERHRWYDIRREEYNAQRPGIVHGLLRNHNLVENGAVESTRDIERLIAREKLLKLKTDSPALQNELEAFFGLYEELEKERDQFKREAESYASEVDQLDERGKLLEWRCKEYQTKLDDSGDVCGAASIAAVLPELPTSLVEVARAAARAFPRLVITENAISTAADYDECKCYNEAWQMLSHLSETLHPLKFTGDDKNFERAFKDKTGFDLAMTEGKMTKDDAKLMRLRRLSHGGRELDITPHVKHGNQEPKLVRIYFSFDDADRKIIVGHIGKHLANYTTKQL